MNIVRWNPRGSWWGLESPSGVERNSFRTPAVDVVDLKDRVVVRAEMPGLDRSEIDVRIEDGYLVLEGERKREDELKEGHAYRVERAYGKFVRRFSLTEDFDAAKVEATYKNGVLEVSVPKAEQVKPRKIEIQAA
jgi:HSP20 family protein